MAASDNIQYRMYEEAYSKAMEANRSGNLREAKKLFYAASDALLLAAKDARGIEQSVWIDRAKKLAQIADSIALPEIHIPSQSNPASNQTNQPGSNTILPKQPSVSQSKPITPSSVPLKQSTSSSPRPTASSAAGGRKTSMNANGNDDETVFIPSEKPNVHFDDIAGLDYVKETINSRIILPRKYPEVYKAFDRSLNSGILLYGPPGTGKTMIAKAIATEIDAVFFSIRCSDIVGKYFGEAERNVRALFETARSQESAILFFDEFEALAAKRGGHSTVMNRLVPELLSQMDGFTKETEKTLILLAATNRPWDLDSAFLRPPRLTEKIYVGLPDAPAREYLINRKFRDLPLAGDFAIDEIVSLTEGFNAADVNAFCETMKDGAIQRTLTIHGGKVAAPINRDDLENAVQKIHSSVQQADITALQRWEATQNIG